MPIAFAVMNYSVSSGSYSPPDPYPSLPHPVILGDAAGGAGRYLKSLSFLPPATTTTITESLTIEYFQRVWDIDNSQWCYYTQTAINASPGTTDTQPNNSGNIISSSVVQILEIY